MRKKRKQYDLYKASQLYNTSYYFKSWKCDICAYKEEQYDLYKASQQYSTPYYFKSWKYDIYIYREEHC